MGKNAVDNNLNVESQPILSDVIPEKIKKKKNKFWDKASVAIEYLLSNETELLNSVLRDFTPKKEITKDELGKETVVTSPATGISWGTIWKGIGFAIRHPNKAWNLFKVATSEETYLDKDFQKKLLEKEVVWDFVQNRSVDLPEIRKILEGAGIKEFSEGNILDSRGLEILAGTLQNDNTIAKLKNIAVETRSDNPDVMKIVGDSLNILATDANLKEFLKEKGSNIQDYVKAMGLNITRSDIIRSMNKALDGNSAEINEILKKNPALQEKLADILNQNFVKPVLEKTKIIEQILALPEFGQLDNTQKQNLKELSETTLSQTKSFLNETLDFYKIDPQILDHVATILTKTPELNEIFQSIQKDGIFVWVDKALDVFTQDPKLKEFIATNPNFIPDLAKGVIDGTPFLKEITEKFKLDNKILDLLGTLLVKPDVASSIIKSVNKGDYAGLTDTLITALNDKEISGLTQVLQKQAKEGLFNNLIVGIVEQSQPFEGTPALSETLANYGITKDRIPQIADIFPVLLDDPIALKQVFDQFKSGQYTEMTTKLLSMVDENPKIAEYFENNKDMFVNVLDKVFENTTTLKGYNLKGDLYNIVPLLLKHPQELTEMINLASAGNHTAIGEKFLDLIQKDTSIKDYFVNNGDKFKQIAVKAAGLEVYGVKDEIAEILKLLMKDEHAPKIKSMLDLYQNGEYTNLLKSACTLMENDPEFKRYLETNRENFAKIVDAVIDKSPAIKTYTQNADIGHLASSIIRNPALIREGIEAYESGSKLGYAKVIAKSVLDPEFRSALVNAATSWVFSGDTGKHDLVNIITDKLSSDRVSQPDGKLLKLSDFVATSISSLPLEQTEQTRLNNLLNKNTLFDNVTIKGTHNRKAQLTNLEIDNITFVNSEIRDVSFQGTKFTNTSFTGANISNVDFTNATIDAYTLKSMIDSIRKNNVSLDGTIITGDLSQIDLSGISLRNADLSNVTSMKDVNLLNCNLTNAILPKALLSDTYNLSRAVLHSEDSIGDIHIAQQNEVIKKAVDRIAEKAKTLNDVVFTTEDKIRLVNKIKELSQDPNIGKYISRTLESTPKDIIEKNFPIRPELLTHVSEYRDKSNSLMSDLYHNMNNVESIKNVVVAGLMADRITEKLFALGDHRAVDGHMIRQMMQSVVSKFSAENPGIDSSTLLTNPKYEQSLDKISNELKAQSKYTRAGYISGGIYIPKEAFTKALENKLKVEMNDTLGAHPFNETELGMINKISYGIAKNLFNDGVDSNRKVDSDLILQNLKDVFYQIKAEKNGADLSTILKESAPKIIGIVDAGMFITDRTGLTELYYNNANYTKTGLVSGGIYLDDNKVVKDEFINSVKTFLEPITDLVKKIPTKTIDLSLQKSVQDIVSKGNITKSSREPVSPTNTDSLKARKRSDSSNKSTSVV